MAVCAISEAFGLDVTWDEKTRTVIVLDSEFNISDKCIDTVADYLIYDRPEKEDVKKLFVG